MPLSIALLTHLHCQTEKHHYIPLVPCPSLPITLFHWKEQALNKTDSLPRIIAIISSLLFSTYYVTFRVQSNLKLWNYDISNNTDLLFSPSPLGGKSLPINLHSPAIRSPPSPPSFTRLPLLSIPRLTSNYNSLSTSSLNLFSFWKILCYTRMYLARYIRCSVHVHNACRVAITCIPRAVWFSITALFFSVLASSVHWLH